MSDSKQTPHAIGAQHSGGMRSPSLCEALFAANRSTRITNTEFRVLTCIMDGLCKRADIAMTAGVSIPTVARAIAKLVSLEWIDRDQKKGKASDLTANLTRIMADTRITHDTTRTPQTRITGDPTKGRTRITHDTRITCDTGQSDQTRIVGDTRSVDNSLAHIENPRARAETPILNITTSEVYPERPETKPTTSAAGVGPVPRILNGSAKGMLAHDLANKLIEVTNSPWLDPRSANLAASAQAIRIWIDEGADFDADIVPTVADLCRNKRSKIASWKYFSDAVRRNAETRKALEEQTLNPIAAKAHHDQSPQHLSRRRGNARSSFTDHMLRACAGDQPDDYGRVESVAIK